MSPTCKTKERIVVLNRLVLSLLPDSIRLSSNIGFSYTGPYEILDTNRTRLAPGLLIPCLSGQVADSTLLVQIKP